MRLGCVVLVWHREGVVPLVYRGGKEGRRVYPGEGGGKCRACDYVCVCIAGGEGMGLGGGVFVRI